jgi:hypothetical protein
MKVSRFIGLALILAMTGLAVGQEGHPMTGVWSGEWGRSAKDEDRNYTTLILTWDGKTLGGTADVGPDPVPIKNATLDSSKWAVRIEYDRKDASGKTMPFVVTGTLQNPSSRVNRMIVGTFTYGTMKGDFKVKMD